MDEGDWEKQLIEKLATAALKEQRRGRRWGIFFKLLGFAYLTIVILLVLDWRGPDSLGSGKHTALVDIVGVIDARGDASADRVTEALQHAFKNKNTQGVILRINSPGGSPVQAGIIYDDIHKQFIDVVKKARGKRLKESPDVFSGLLWTGERSVELGLSDGLGSVDYVAREVIKAEDIFDFTKKQDITERFVRRFGATMTGALSKVLGQ